VTNCERDCVSLDAALSLIRTKILKGRLAMSWLGWLLLALVHGGYAEADFTAELQENLEVESNLTNATLAEEALVGVRDETHPLVTLLETTPHAMSLLIKPWNYHPDTMVRLLYERVSNSKQKRPIMAHLDDPVIVYIPLIRHAQSYSLTELPMGKYIVCGEAMLHAEVYQTSCFETIIQRLDTNSLQSGVRVLIILSMGLVAAVIVYAIIYRVIKLRTLRKNKALAAETVVRA